MLLRMQSLTVTSILRWKTCDFNQEVYNWVVTHNDVNRWAWSRFPFKQWDKITTNISKSFKAWLVKERKHHVIMLIHEHHEKVANKTYAVAMAMKEWKN